jgi:NAD+ kinase
MKKRKIKTVGIKLKPTQIDSFDAIISNLVKWLHRRKVVIHFFDFEEARIQKKCGSSLQKLITFSNEKEFYSSSDLVLSLGGDGTLIGASHLVSKSTPIFGINLGRLGFITEYTKTNFYDALEQTLKGYYTTEKRNLFNAKIYLKDKIIGNYFFLNDLVINKNDIARMFSVNVECDGENIYNISGDGLIVSTPIGSTAYSLAAGGPIVHPQVKAVVLTPICPHTLTNRPLVINDSSKIAIFLLEKDNTVSLTLDGQNVVDFNSSHRLVITKSRTKQIKLIKNPDKSYFQILKEKFFHGR